MEHVSYTARSKVFFYFEKKTNPPQLVFFDVRLTKC